MLVYVAGKYSGKTNKEVQDNIDEATNIAIELWNMGHTVLCPHMNSAHLEDEVNFDHPEWIKRSLILLERCDALVTVPGWEASTGAVCEVEYAKNYGIPIFHYPSDPRSEYFEILLHPTEEKNPLQCRAFMQTLMGMYRVHLSKNADYQSANVLACGEIGLVTRLWDKVARLMSLTGFRFDVSNPRFVGAKDPKHESIDDTLLDLANYGVIGLLLRQGLWGK